MFSRTLERHALTSPKHSTPTLTTTAPSSRNDGSILTNGWTKGNGQNTRVTPINWPCCGLGTTTWHTTSYHIESYHIISCHTLPFISSSPFANPSLILRCLCHAIDLFINYFREPVPATQYLRAFGCCITSYARPKWWRIFAAR